MTYSRDYSLKFSPFCIQQLSRFPPSKLDNSCACFTDNSVSYSSNVTPNGYRDVAKNDNKSSELCQNSIIAVEQTNIIGYIIDASNI